MARKWEIIIPNMLGGYAPAWIRDTYPAIGNKNMAGDMKNVGLFNPASLVQGSGVAKLTNGDENGAMASNITGMTKIPYHDGSSIQYSYGIGKNTLYQLRTGIVINTGNFPRTLTTTNSEAITDSFDAKWYKSKVYYTYNTDGNAYLGRDDGDGATYDDRIATLDNNDVDHPLCRGGNDILYIGDKNQVAAWDGSALTNPDLDLPDDFVITSKEWTDDRLWIVANKAVTPALSGSTAYGSYFSVFIYDGYSPSWDNEFKFRGQAGGTFLLDGVLHIFYADPTSSDKKLAKLIGGELIDVATFRASKIPNKNQIDLYQGFIVFSADYGTNPPLYAYGSPDPKIAPYLFQFAQGAHSGLGAIACPYTNIVISTASGSSYNVSQLSGYHVDSNWKSILFNVNKGRQGRSMIDELIVPFEAMASGARVDITLRHNLGAANPWTGTISHTLDGASVIQKKFRPQQKAKNFRLEFDYTNGSTSNSVKIRFPIIIRGHTL